MTNNRKSKKQKDCAQGKIQGKIRPGVTRGASC